MKPPREFAILNRKSKFLVTTAVESSLVNFIGLPITIDELSKLNKSLRSGKVIRRGEYLIFESNLPALCEHFEVLMPKKEAHP